MKRPRDLRHRQAIRGVASSYGADCQVPLADSITRQPREWRRAAAWLRKVADWWEFLADEQELKQQRPIRRRLWVYVKMQSVSSKLPDLRVACANNSGGRVVVINARYAMEADECRTLAAWLVKAAKWIEAKEVGR